MMRPKVAIVGVKGAWSTETLADAIEARTGYRRIVDAGELVADYERMTLSDASGDLCRLDGIVVKKIAASYSHHALDRVEMLRLAECAGVRVFSPIDAFGPLINRLSCTSRLRCAGIPVPPTVVTESLEVAVRALERWGAAVCKPMYTSKAVGMALIRAGFELRDDLERFQAAGHRVMYLQQWVESGGRDLGVTFIGGRYLATYARTRGEGAWSTSTAAGGRYVGHEPAPEVIALAAQAQALFGLDFTCVDVVETRLGPWVYEVSAFGGFRGLAVGCGLDAAGRYADYLMEELQHGR